MSLYAELSKEFMTNIKSVLANAGTFLNCLDLSRADSGKVLDIVDNYNHLVGNGPTAEAQAAFKKLIKLLKLSHIVSNMEQMDSTYCYYIAMDQVTIIFSENKIKYVDNMNKMLYVLGIIPVHKERIIVHKKNLYCALYIANTYTPNPPTVN